MTLVARSASTQGGVANLENSTRVSDVQAVGSPQPGGDLGDLLVSAGLGQSPARDQYGGWVKELGQRLLVMEHEGVLQQRFQLPGRAGSGLHDGPLKAQPVLLEDRSCGLEVDLAAVACRQRRQRRRIHLDAGGAELTE